MKKDELRNDPIRDKMLNALSFFGKNRLISISVAITIAAGIVFILSSTDSNDKVDYSACFNSSENIDLEKYCEQETIKKALDDIKKEQDSSEYLLSFLTTFLTIGDDKKIEALNKLDFKQIDAVYLKSMLYKIYGDLLVQNSEVTKGIEKYQKALEVFNDKRTYSALINYKIANIYKLDNKNLKSKKYLDLALACDISERAVDVTQKIEILESRLQHALSRGSK